MIFIISKFCIYLLVISQLFIGYKETIERYTIQQSTEAYKPTGEEVLYISDKIYEIFIQIIRPTYDHLEERTGIFVYREMDYVWVIEYFRDNDFSEELAQMEALLPLIPELEFGEPAEYPMARTTSKGCIGMLRRLCELGERYKGKEVEEWSDLDDMTVYGLTVYRFWDQEVFE